MKKMPQYSKVTLELDEEAATAVIAALVLYQRVAMGLWDLIVDAAPTILDERASSEELAADLLNVRSKWTTIDALKRTDQALNIRGTDRTCRVIYDVWQRMSEVRGRSVILLTGARIKVGIEYTDKMEPRLPTPPTDSENNFNRGLNHS
jgi:hypothetical protein